MALANRLACAKCGSTANQDQIIRNKLLNRGRKCNNCVNAIAKARRERDPVMVKLNNIYSGAKRRADQRGLEFDLTLDYLRSLVTWYCPALGIQLDWSLKGSGNTSPCSPSLDRIDSSKGYTKSNTVIISRRANTIKNDANAKELLLIGEWLHGLQLRQNRKGLSKNKIKLTDLHREQITQLKRQGMTYRQIAEAVNCSKSMVGYILNKVHSKNR